MMINKEKKYRDQLTIKEIKSKSILRKHKKIDSWFLSRYGMNLYRGCSHNCVYCDGRSEKYYVDGEFGEDVAVKINAIEVLNKELKLLTKNSRSKQDFIILGGGVGDSYQPIENKYQLSRKALQLIQRYNFPVHILTKSTIVERDLDIIKQINERNRAIVSFSFSTVDDNISSIFEPGVPPPNERLKSLALFKKEGITCGMFLLPVIPFVTDTPDQINNTIKKASELGIDFIIFGGLTLKEGKQKNYFTNVLKKYNPELQLEYQHIYRGDKWGSPIEEYYNSINQTFNAIVKQYKIPKRIPPKLYRDILYENDLVMVMLEHIDYLLKLEGKPSPYGYAAYSISKLKQPLSTIKKDLQKIKGVGKTTERIILEILETKSSSFLSKLLAG